MVTTAVREGRADGEKAAGRGGDDTHSTRRDCTHISLEPQSPAPVPASISGLARDNAQETSLDPILDLNQVRNHSESEGRSAGGVIAVRSEGAPKIDNSLSLSKQSKGNRRTSKPTTKRRSPGKGDNRERLKSDNQLPR
jgi:hypothetical protein